MASKDATHRAMVARTLSKAVDVLGSRGAARRWVLSPAVGLDGARPRDLLRTEEGARAVTLEHLQQVLPCAVLPQCGLVDLSHGGHGQLLQDEEPPRERGRFIDGGLGESQQFVLRDASALPQRDIGHRHFARVGVQHAHRARIGHCGVPHQALFDDSRVDVVAAADDQDLPRLLLLGLYSEATTFAFAPTYLKSPGAPIEWATSICYSQSAEAVAVGRSGGTMGSRLSGPSKPAPGAEALPVVFVVDDDVSVRESLELLIRAGGWQPEIFESALKFLDRPRIAAPSCLLLDLEMPGVNGLELQKRLAADRTDLPIIFITGHGDVPLTVEAMKRGAVEFLTKPFDDQVLLEAVASALERSRLAMGREAHLNELRARSASLSPREREVMALVVAGLLNKQIGGEMGISEITVKAHRGSMMRKMKARSLPDLVNMAAQLGIPGPDSPSR